MGSGRSRSVKQGMEPRERHQNEVGLCCNILLKDFEETIQTRYSKCTALVLGFVCETHEHWNKGGRGDEQQEGCGEEMSPHLPALGGKEGLGF